MKKVSTVATRQSRNISQQKLTIGLDLGDRNSWYCVLDEAGQIQVEQRVRTSAKMLQEVFSGMPRSRVALETGTHSPWISRLLSDMGHEVIVANVRKVSYGQRLRGCNVRNMGKKRAIVATARELAVLLHHLWGSGEVYEPLHNSRRTTVAAAA